MIALFALVSLRASNELKFGRSEKISSFAADETRDVYGIPVLRTGKYRADDSPCSNWLLKIYNVKYYYITSETEGLC